MVHDPFHSEQKYAQDQFGYSWSNRTFPCQRVKVAAVSFFPVQIMGQFEASTNALQIIKINLSL